MVVGVSRVGVGMVVVIGLGGCLEVVVGRREGVCFCGVVEGVGVVVDVVVGVECVGLVM